MSKTIPISKKERGAIAVMAASLMPLFILIALLMARSGVLRVAREEVEGTADSLALAYANQIVVNPGPQVAIGAAARGPTIQTTGPFLGGSTGLRGNHCADCIVVDQHVVAPSQTALSIDGYHPYTSIATVHRGAKEGSTLSQAFNKFIPTSSQFNFEQDATARAWVPQVALSQFTLLKQPLMLVIDYSGGFQLPMKNELSQQPSVLTVQQTVRQIVGDTMADTMKLGMADIFNFGLIMFSSSPSDDLFHPQPDQQTLGQSMSLNQQQQTNDATFIYNMLPSTTLPEDPLKPGTNLQAPIDLAVNMLNLYDFGDPQYYGVRPSIMIVTDGMPNLYDGGGSKVDYAGAASAAQDSTTRAWNNKTPAQSQMTTPPGIATYTIKVERQVSSTNVNESGQDQKVDGFFNAMSGSRSNPSNISNYITVDSGGSFMNALHAIPVITHCVSSPLDDWSQGPESGQNAVSVPKAVLPTADDVINGYFVINKYSTTAKELTVGRVMSYDDLITSDGEGDTMNYDYGSVSSGDVDTGQSLFKFYFDPAKMRVVLNGHLCNTIQQLRAAQQTNYQFRMRWSPVVMSCGATGLAGCPQPS